MSRSGPKAEFILTTAKEAAALGRPLIRLAFADPADVITSRTGIASAGTTTAGTTAAGTTAAGRAATGTGLTGIELTGAELTGTGPARATRGTAWRWGLLLGFGWLIQAGLRVWVSRGEATA